MAKEDEQGTTTKPAAKSTQAFDYTDEFTEEFEAAHRRSRDASDAAIPDAPKPLTRDERVVLQQELAASKAAADKELAEKVAAELAEKIAAEEEYQKQQTSTREARATKEAAAVERGNAEYATHVANNGSSTLDLVEKEEATKEEAKEEAKQNAKELSQKGFKAKFDAYTTSKADTYGNALRTELVKDPQIAAYHQALASLRDTTGQIEFDTKGFAKAFDISVEHAQSAFNASKLAETGSVLVDKQEVQKKILISMCNSFEKSPKDVQKPTTLTPKQGNSVGDSGFVDDFGDVPTAQEAQQQLKTNGRRLYPTEANQALNAVCSGPEWTQNMVADIGYRVKGTTVVLDTVRDHGTDTGSGHDMGEALGTVKQALGEARPAKILMPVSVTKTMPSFLDFWPVNKIEKLKRAHFTTLEVNIDKDGKVSATHIDSAGKKIGGLYNTDHIKNAVQSVFSGAEYKDIYTGHQGVRDGVNCGRFSVDTIAQRMDKPDPIKGPQDIERRTPEALEAVDNKIQNYAISSATVVISPEQQVREDALPPLSDIKQPSLEENVAVQSSEQQTTKVRSATASPNQSQALNVAAMRDRHPPHPAPPTITASTTPGQKSAGQAKAGGRQ